MLNFWLERAGVTSEPAEVHIATISLEYNGMEHDKVRSVLVWRVFVGRT